MQVPAIFVCGEKAARIVLTNPLTAGDFSYAISIRDTNAGAYVAPMKELGAVPHLGMCFDDHPANPAHGVTMGEIESIIMVARHMQGLGRTCLIHCLAGKSRSPATAIIIRAVWYGCLSLQRAVNETFVADPLCYPNLNMIAKADHLLHLGGELLSMSRLRFAPLEVSP